MRTLKVRPPALAARLHRVRLNSDVTRRFSVTRLLGRRLRGGRDTFVRHASRPPRDPSGGLTTVEVSTWLTIHPIRFDTGQNLRPPRLEQSAHPRGSSYSSPAPAVFAKPWLPAGVSLVEGKSSNASHSRAPANRRAVSIRGMHWPTSSRRIWSRERPARAARSAWRSPKVSRRSRSGLGASGRPATMRLQAAYRQLAPL